MTGSGDSGWAAVVTVTTAARWSVRVPHGRQIKVPVLLMLVQGGRGAVVELGDPDAGEGNPMRTPLKLHLQGCKIPYDIAAVNEPWCAQDDVDVITDAEEEGVYLECHAVNP